MIRLTHRPLSTNTVPSREALDFTRGTLSALVALVPEPPPAPLASLEQIPAQAPRAWTLHRFDAEKRTTIRETREAPLVQRLTEQAAIQDLRPTLRLIDQEKISVSATTLFPSRASMALLCGLLREGDFFELTGNADDLDPEIGPIKGFSWPLLVQAAKFAVLRNGRLTLTKLGRNGVGQSEVFQGSDTHWDHEPDRDPLALAHSPREREQGLARIFHKVCGWEARKVDGI